MPFAEINGNRVFFSIEGSADKPVVMLSHSLGVASTMWDFQMPALLESFRVVRYDTRGHGQTAASEGSYSIAQLGEDALALMDHLGVERTQFCGLSMGGMIGQWIAVHAPDRVSKLVLANTAARIGTPEMWNQRIETVTQQGMPAVTEAVIDRWFTPEARTVPALVAPVRTMLLATSSTGYVGCCAAIRDLDQRHTVSRITAPTLVIAGSSDTVTPLADAEFLAGAISHARLVGLPAAHLSNIEAAAGFTEALMTFLQEGPL